MTPSGKLADCMRREKRTPDILSRYGGDEFVLLLPETKAIDAAILLERIRAKAQQICLDQGMGLSVSCGIAESLPETDEAPGDVMRRADMALYEAKNGGRNCVKVWDQGMTRLINTGELEIERIKKLQRRLMGLSEKAEKVFMESIWSLVQALEAKDTYARKHSENVVALLRGHRPDDGAGAQVRGPDPPGRHDPRHRQDRHPRRHPVQARPPDAPRAADRRAAPADRRAHSREDELPGKRDRHCPAPPREMERPGLPGWSGPDRDSPGGAGSWPSPTRSTP